MKRGNLPVGLRGLIVPINISDFRFYKNEEPPEHSMVLSEATHININRKKHKPDIAMLSS